MPCAATTPSFESRRAGERNMKKSIALVGLLLLSRTCFAEGLSGAAQREISHLFSYLANSGCQFKRNGSWYSAQEAVDHLTAKYQYLSEGAGFPRRRTSLPARRRAAASAGRPTSSSAAILRPWKAQTGFRPNSRRGAGLARDLPASHDRLFPSFHLSLLIVSGTPLCAAQ